MTINKALVAALVSALPATVIAAGLTRACGTLAREQPGVGADMLGNLWMKFAPILLEYVKKNPTGEQSAAILVIEQYFLTKGNWREMEANLLQGAPLHPAMVDHVVHLFNDGVMSAAASLAGAPDHV